MANYSSLNKAQLSYDYLHTNSTTHEFLFGAVAELIDNSRDAQATVLNIYEIPAHNLRGGFMIVFADNGCGMSPEETKNVVIFGSSKKRNTLGKSIGMYGNGLKSGSMRIGNDMIIFTKRDQVYTCLLLSRTFHEKEKLNEVIVPMPSFNAPDMSPHFPLDEDNLEKHDLEIDIILKHSPFKTKEQLLENFYTINGDSGTIVVIYNVKLTSSGGPELDLKSDKNDILLVNYEDKDDVGDYRADNEIPLEKRSLRAYISILYADPRMKVYIRGRKVRTKRLLSTLTNVMRYEYSSKTFKNRVETECAKSKLHVKNLEAHLRESESKVIDFEGRMNQSSDTNYHKELRRLQMQVSQVKADLLSAQEYHNQQQKSIREPKSITFYFGLNIQNRAADGMFVYNSTRLIKMYQRIGPQQDSSMMCRGVMGIVDVPYMILEPTHNKQDFADAKEFRMLMRAMADHLMQYWDDLNIENKFTAKNEIARTILTTEESIYRFWKSYGYLSAKWRDPPSSEEKYVRKRTACLQTCVQCDACLKWRILPAADLLSGREIKDDWKCTNNSDPRHRRCEDPEEDLNPSLGVLRRKIKSKEQRQTELANQIKKKQEELEKIRVDDDVVDRKTSHIKEDSSDHKRKKVDLLSLLSSGTNTVRKRPGPTAPPQAKGFTSVKKVKSETTKALTVADKKAAQRNSLDARNSQNTVDTSPSPTTKIKDRVKSFLSQKTSNDPVSSKRKSLRKKVFAESDSEKSSSSSPEEDASVESAKPSGRRTRQRNKPETITLIDSEDEEGDNKAELIKKHNQIQQSEANTMNNVNSNSETTSNGHDIKPVIEPKSEKLIKTEAGSSTEEMSGKIDNLCQVIKTLIPHLIPPNYKDSIEKFNGFNPSQLIDYDYDSMISEYDSTMNLCFNKIRESRDQMNEAGNVWISALYNEPELDTKIFKEKISSISESLKSFNQEEKDKLKELFKLL